MEYYYKASTRETLHRCERCVRTFYRIHNNHVKDNGFVSLRENPHLYEFCKESQKAK